ncbi:MAG: TonB-dependent receptor, partial [Planctomycetota bacterium]
ARYLGRLGQRHLVEFTLFDADVERDRFGQELFTEILTPVGTQNLFILGDQRSTRRGGANVRGSTGLGERLEWRWGAETERETTTYDYRYVGRSREPPFSGQSDIVFIEDEIEQDRFGFYSEAQWQLRTDTTLSGGARYDTDDLSGDSALMPRLGLSVRAGRSVWRASWSRVTDFPSSHELQLADFEETLPTPETSDFASLGYERAWGGHRLAIEAYSQKTEDPRLRFVSLFRSVSRFPELEIDRLRVDADESRNQGLEARYGFRGQRYEVSAAYELSRFEDKQLDGSWRPRISDRRHSLQLWLVAELPYGLHADLLWRGVSGRPTTALDTELATVDFASGLGEINGERLPWEHRLDLRLSREWKIGPTNIRVMLGFDNLFDKRNTLGLRLFQLFPYDQVPSPEVLIAERSLGREHRWSLEFSW